MKLLNTLKNHEILPYFWNSRKSAPTIELDFIDLFLLKQALKAKEPSKIEDFYLEKLLFGTSKSPFFSGWTTDCLEQTLHHTGFSLKEKPISTELMTKAIVVQSPWSRESQKKVKRDYFHQKQWEFRKSLRAKSTETFSRIKASFLSPLKKQGELWLNLGAGLEEYEGYIKVDLGGNQHLYDNVVTLSKISPNTISRIYSNHVLEHIATQDIPAMLKQWFQVLKPGGIVLVRVPDAKQAILHLNEPWAEASDEAIKKIELPNYLARENTRSGTLDIHSTIQTIYGWSSSTPHSWDIFNQHKSLWTPALAKKRFEEAGFFIEFADNLGSIQTVLRARKI